MVSKKITKIIDIIGLGSLIALLVVGIVVIIAMLSSISGNFTSYLGLAGYFNWLFWIIIMLTAMIPLRKYFSFYKIDKTFSYSILIAIFFLISAVLLWKYVFPSIVLWLLSVA